MCPESYVEQCNPDRPQRDRDRNSDTLEPVGELERFGAEEVEV